MAGPEDDSAEKSHEPTPRKLDEARRKGEVPRSADLNTAASYGGLLLAGLAFGAGSLTGLGAILADMLGRAERHAPLFFDGPSAPISGRLLADMTGPLAPWALLPAALVALSIAAQRSFTVTLSKLEPKLSRLSPIQTAKQKFGRTGLFEFAKSVAKLCLYTALLGLFLAQQLPRLMATMALGPGPIMAEMVRMTMQLLMLVLVITLALGLLDAVVQRAEHLRKNRMSRKELTDEMKETEGDPAMKQQRRAKAQEIALSQMMADVPGADVVIVNPTHFAVALAWDRASGRAPVCVAKGVDEIAARIRTVATEHGVAIHSDPPTARALHGALSIGDEVQPDHYKAVAAAIRFAETLRRKARR